MLHRKRDVGLKEYPIEAQEKVLGYGQPGAMMNWDGRNEVAESKQYPPSKRSILLLHVLALFAILKMRFPGQVELSMLRLLALMLLPPGT
jgi:hypothetical protein